jgi:hypothetical protein
VENAASCLTGISDFKSLCNTIRQPPSRAKLGPPWVVRWLPSLRAPMRHDWRLGATAWDRIWEIADLLFPALACVGAAMTTRLRRETIDSMIDRVLKDGIPENGDAS